MTTCSTTGPANSARKRWLSRVALFTAALALAASPFVHPASSRASYDPNYYNLCRASSGQGAEYCCSQASGALISTANGEVCVDPASLTVPTQPTVTQRQTTLVPIPASP
jgi:hypothetical protein